MGQLTPPATVTQFKTQFTRDFTYGTGMETVRDIDIQNALNVTSSAFNPQLFDTTVLTGSTSEALLAYLYASAHFLVTALQAAGGLAPGGRKQGAKSQGAGPVGSKAVGSVSLGYVWPDSITNNPMLFQFVRTNYGQQYLQMLVTKLVGNVRVVLGPVQDPGLFNNPTDV